jgi:hypothetical protein
MLQYEVYISILPHAGYQQNEVDQKRLLEREGFTLISTEHFTTVIVQILCCETIKPRIWRQHIHPITELTTQLNVLKVENVTSVFFS